MADMYESYGIRARFKESVKKNIVERYRETGQRIYRFYIAINSMVLHELYGDDDYINRNENYVTVDYPLDFVLSNEFYVKSIDYINKICKVPFLEQELDVYTDHLEIFWSTSMGNSGDMGYVGYEGHRGQVLPTASGYASTSGMGRSGAVEWQSYTYSMPTSTYSIPPSTYSMPINTSPIREMEKLIENDEWGLEDELFEI